MNTIIRPHEHLVNYCCHMTVNTQKARAEHFGEWFRRQLKSRGLKQVEFADRIEVDKGVVGNWFRGNRLPTPQSCEKIANGLHINPDTVLDVAGYRDLDLIVDPDSAEAKLLPLIRKINWDADPMRLEGLMFQLEGWLRVDRKRKESEK